MELDRSMNAMVMEAPGRALILKIIPVPRPEAGELLVKVLACGICRTDLHIHDGELPGPKLPLILGHEIIGTVVKTGHLVSRFSEGDVVGIPWVGHTCEKCKYCKSGLENLCDHSIFTGYTKDGGFAEFTVADERFCFAIPRQFQNPSGTPLMCAGLIGFRSYNMLADSCEKIGIYGFGAAAHILIQIAQFQGKKVFAFTRPGDQKAKQFAIDLGAVWAGDSTTNPPELLDAAIIFAPVGSLIPAALNNTVKGGSVICGGIYMSDVPSFPYHLLWGERSVKSVANLTRKDGERFFKLLSEVPVRTEVTLYKLSQANKAMEDLRTGKISGAAVLVPED